MNSQSTSRIVIGAGMAVVVGVGGSIFAVRAKNESAALHKPIAQMAVNQTPSESAVTDQNASSVAPGAMSAPPAAAAQTSAPTATLAPSNNVVASDATNAPADKSKTPDKHVAKASSERANIRVASADSKTIESAPSDPSPDAQNKQEADPQQVMTNAAPSASTEPVTSDSQITTQVKSEIAAAGTSSNVDVKTTDGVVAIAGSVPSQNDVDQVKQAAQRVAGVKHVDTSTLTVGNP